RNRRWPKLLAALHAHARKSKKACRTGLLTSTLLLTTRSSPLLTVRATHCPGLRRVARALKALVNPRRLPRRLPLKQPAVLPWNTVLKILKFASRAPAQAVNRLCVL